MCVLPHQEAAISPLANKKTIQLLSYEITIDKAMKQFRKANHIKLFAIFSVRMNFSKEEQQEKRTKAGSRTESEPEFYKPVLSYFCRTLTETEPHFSKS